MAVNAPHEIQRTLNLLPYLNIYFAMNFKGFGYTMTSDIVYLILGVPYIPILDIPKEL